MTVERSLAGDGSFAANVERRERIHLPSIRLADDHPVLLQHVGIRSRRFHAAEFEGQTPVLVQIGQHGGGFDGFRGKAQRRQRAHGALHLGDGAAVLGDEQAGDSVVRTHALDVLLNDRDAGRSPRLDGRVQLLDRRLVQPKRRVVGARLHAHGLRGTS
jgi:hypothetical protein